MVGELRTVFLSGTRRDLGGFFEAARIAIGKELAGYRVSTMEEPTPEDIPVARWSRREATVPDLLVGLVGRYYGTARGGGPSLSEQEFDCAGAAGVPRLMFLTEAGDPSLTELQSPEERQQVESLRGRLQNGDLLIRRDIATPEEFAREVVRAIHAWERRTLRGVLMPAKRFVELNEPSTPDGLLSHRHPYVGAPALLEMLEGFATSGQRILVLHGPWGRGKTRLLLEWSGVTRAELRFLREDVTLSHEALRAAVDDPYVLVVEDVHKLLDDSKQALLHFLRTRGSNLKLVVTTRTNRLDSFKTVLRGQHIEPALVLIREVEALREPEQRQLIASILGKDDEWAYILARRTQGNALAGVVAARAALQGKANIREIEGEHFESAVIESFLDAVLENAEGEPARRDRYRKVLRLVAVAGPVLPADADGMEALARFSGLPRYELHEDFAALETAGLLMRHGGLVRIPVDAIAEHLVVDASVSPQGESKDYVEQALETLAVSFLGNILRNLATADWDPEQTGRVTSVTGRVWERVPDLYERMAATRQQEIRGVIEEISPLHPEPALRFALRFLVPAMTGTESDASASQSFLFHARRNLTRLLRNVLGAPGCVARACDVLWRLAEPESTTNNPLPDSPELALRDAGEYRPTRTLAAYEAFVSWAEARSRGENKIPGYRLAHYLSSLLHKELMHSWSDGKQITLQAQGLLYSYWAPLRRRVIDLLVRIAIEGDWRDAQRALNALGGALAHQPGSFQRHVSNGERSQWVPEQEYALACLRQLRQERSSRILDLCMPRQLSWLADREPSPALRAEARLLMDEMQRALAGTLEHALVGRNPDDRRDYREAERKRQEALSAAARSLADPSVSPEDSLARLTQAAVALCDAEQSPRVEELFNHVAQTSPSVAMTWALMLVRKPGHPLRAAMNGLVRGLLGSAPDAGTALMEVLFTDRSPDLLSGISFVDSDVGLLGETKVVALLERMLTHPAESVRANAFQQVASLDGLAARVRAGLLLCHSVNEALRLAETWANAVTEEAVYAVYGREEKEALARALRTPCKLGYGCGQLMKKLVEDVPAAMVDTMLARIEAVDREGTDFDAVPHVSEHETPLSRELPPAERQRAMLALSGLLEHENIFVREHARRWFSELAPVDSEARRVVRRHWLQAGTPGAVSRAIGSFEDEPPTSLFDQEDEVVQLLEAAQRCGPDLLEFARQMLARVARGGLREGTPGAPFPLDLEIRDRARAHSQKHPSGTLAERLYRQLAEDLDAVLEPQQWKSGEEKN
ncbi:DUF4062 domain-containing protein [Corallococcus exercitus]|uniref:DUF4062 domain-containing protein n=1 Tax=Corallococcus exercitus TaxID=2316736 RepID=A0A7Y4NSY7_9BACT|nr:DUF4062 domain-containing protein [Corallococcus exercitus]NOK36054.1 DUF4062 domain-containing protein [Corallococcus exercitus]